MKRIHKILSVLIVLTTTLIAFLFKAQMTDTTAQSLVTFFSVVFGFYMTSIAILYNADYTKDLHKKIDEKTQKRGTHTLKSYLTASGYCSILSILSIIIFTTFVTKNSEGILYTKNSSISLILIEESIDINLVLSSILFGISALNIFYMLLLLHTIIDGMIEEAKK